MARRILVAALDWGLGHATRCVPIINRLLARQQEVFIASSGTALSFLQQQFPHLESITLPAYNIRYSKGTSQSLVLLRQWPHIRRVIQQEHHVISSLIDRYDIGAIISDNRYGLWSKKIPAVFLTHQLSPMAPFFGCAINPALRAIHYSMLTRFSYVWIPDVSGPLNLSGKLSHGFPLPANTSFIGPLSQFSTYKSHENTDTEPAIVAVLSGPEPQRGIFETILTKEAHQTGIPIIIVRGVQEGTPGPETEGCVTRYHFLCGENLGHLLTSSSLIISRPGYTSLMDVTCLDLQAAFVPTPGQTEQAYLAAYHKGLGHYYSMPQQAFSLEKTISTAKQYRGLKIDTHKAAFHTAIENLIGVL